MKRSLHIVSLNIPYPPDYGGMIDTFYRIKALKSIGVSIHLHCFEYGRSHSEELNSVCEEVIYYPRDLSLLCHFSFLPYIVASRSSNKLLQNLLKDDFPILFDGLHSTFHIKNQALRKRKKIIRMHNIEHRYYMSLANLEKNVLKKMYYLAEYSKLKLYEKILVNADGVLTVSDIDQDYFIGRYLNAVLIPSFHPFDNCESLTGFGEYILFHGDLSVNENDTIAAFLIAEVFSKIPYRCIIAGKNPSVALQSKVMHHSNINLISNPDSNSMNGLIRNAHIHVILSLANTGLKIKLLYALYSGRHCLVNSAMTQGNKLGELCYIFNSGEEIVKNIQLIINQPFTEEMIAKRNILLSDRYSNINNAAKILDLLDTTLQS